MNAELSWALSALCVVVAAVVRGLTGFGFAAIAVVGLAMLGSLRDAVPVVLCLEVASSVMLLRSAIAEADYRLLRRVLLAAACGVPLGIGVLTGLNSDWLSLGVYLLVAALALLGLARVALPMGRGPLAAILVGGSSGALIAAFSIGGPLVVAWLSHCGLRARVLRATLIMFFFAVDLAALAGLALAQAIGPQAPRQALALLLPLLLGLGLGQRLFLRIGPEPAARITQWLLLALAGFGLLGRAWS
ncbi:sulfite exporter TauE/SafE family protein [Pseudomonas abieticivorans]|uniref:sulfite exporter TauE/SafE family protein n=1 Tax=Pseudomonas abieticivorans TaxID=2931382 RepID=UPI0020BEF778|nr:sulfite exporter TauE/SafE family protein [Pseudomonas sp. PIA16]